MDPRLLLPILALLAQVEIPPESQANDFVEVCSGEGQLSRALWSCQFQGKAFDVLYSKNHNFLRTVGFLAVLAAVRNTRRGGLLFFAPPCSTWVFLSSPSTGRTWISPEGFRTRCVLLANIFVMRMLYILWYAWQRGVYVAIEQPISSVLFDWAPVKRLLTFIGARKVTFPMGSYGAATMKYTTIWSTPPGISSLRRPLDVKQLREALARNATNLVRKTIDKKGRRRVAGIKSELAKSANYPRGFGMAIAALVPARGRRPIEKGLDLTYQGTDHLGSLDDFMKGSKRTEWRKPTFTG
ncbi:unnamed protein product [Cladocopium goreaui]|uniref:Uncharacterized protein n=1 Tax=Cladocopium goreaui TaxID=2562237 RepID=A0A9P1M2T9_9DINO|nr:unnamed protein product [Cladocopium goreaui]